MVMSKKQEEARLILETMIVAGQLARRQADRGNVGASLQILFEMRDTLDSLPHETLVNVLLVAAAG